MARVTKYFVKDLSHKDSQPVEVDLTPLDDARFAVTLDGVTSEAEVLALPGGGLSVVSDSAAWSYDFEDKGAELLVTTPAARLRFDVADERTVKLRAANAAFTVEGKQAINAPMPGKVVKVLVKVGDEVTEGQGLVIVEAMKMENELKSPKAGKVTAVLAKEGTAVENGAPLLEVE